MENRRTSSMTTALTSPFRRSLRPARRAAVVALAGAGIALTPLPALAHTSGGTPAAPVTVVSSVVAPTAASQVAVDTALAQVGDQYVWAAAGPDAFDCSGLTMYAWAAAGVELPHSSLMQSAIGSPVSYEDLQPGDLVF